MSLHRVLILQRTRRAAAGICLEVSPAGSWLFCMHPGVCGVLQGPQYLPAVWSRTLSIAVASYTSQVPLNYIGNYLDLYINATSDTAARQQRSKWWRVAAGGAVFGGHPIAKAGKTLHRVLKDNLKSSLHARAR